MALSEKDKKLLPIVVLAGAAVAGYIYYDFFYEPTPQVADYVLPPEQQLEHVQEPAESPTSSLDISSREIDISSPKITHSDVQVLDLTDARGNPVEAVIEPAPIPVTYRRSMQLSEDDRQIINLMRDNFLLTLQMENAKLKLEKEEAVSGVNGNSVVGTQATSFDANSMVGFTELETVKPALLDDSGVPETKINEAFSRIELKSLVVNLGDEVTAWAAIDGNLVKAKNNLVVGDFLIAEVTPQYVAVTYLPSNVTRKLGHVGFSGQ
ncbi:hypothetical protein ACPV5U_24325 [Vibrio mediterranei]